MLKLIIIYIYMNTERDIEANNLMVEFIDYMDYIDSLITVNPEYGKCYEY